MHPSEAFRAIALCGLICAAFSACSRNPVVVVHLDADPALREDATTVNLVVRNAADQIQYDESRERAELSWPATLPIRIVNRDAEHVSVVGTLETSTRRTIRVVASIRRPARGGHVWLYFREACANQECGASLDETCFEGQCRGACYEPSDTPMEPGSCGSGGLDGGVDGGVSDAEVPADTGAPDAGCTGCCAGDECIEGVCTPPTEQAADTVSIWFQHGCASGPGSRTWCWGDETQFDQVGNPGPAGQQMPVYIGNVGQVNLNGGSHSCAVAGRQRTCWGANTYGELGLGTKISSTVPTGVSESQMWDSVATGINFSCGRTTSGELWCWGRNIMGILAQPPATVQESAVPLRIMSASGTPMQFGAFDTGNHFVLGISNRKVYGWGQNLFNQLGEIPNVNTPVPTEIPLPAGVTPVRVSAGQQHGCVLSEAGRIYCWGSGSNTIILGRPSSDTSPPERPAEVPHPESMPWDSVSIGEGHACAIDTLQNLYCWGQNDNFQLGSPMGNTSTPTRVPVDLQFSAVSTGPRGTCARTTSRAIYCWGVNTGRVLGLPDVDAIVMTPTRVCLPAP